MKLPWNTMFQVVKVVSLFNFWNTVYAIVHQFVYCHMLYYHIFYSHILCKNICSKDFLAFIFTHYILNSIFKMISKFLDFFSLIMMRGYQFFLNNVLSILVIILNDKFWTMIVKTKPNTRRLTRQFKKIWVIENLKILKHQKTAPRSTNYVMGKPEK